MMAVGGLFHRKEVSILGTYYFMVFDWKHVSKSITKLRNDITKEAKDLKKHDIEAIHREMENIDKEIDTTGEYSYKLAYRDLLLLRRAILHLRVLARDVHENVHNVEDIEKKIIQKVKGQKIEKDFLELLRKDQHADEFAQQSVKQVINEAHQGLQSEQKGIYGLEVEMKGRRATSLIFRGNAEGFWRMMQLRWGAIRRLRKNLRLEIKNEHKIKEDFKTAVDGFNNLHERIREHRVDLKYITKTVKRERGDIDDILKELTDLFQTIRDVIKDSYKIFLFDLILLKVAIQNIFSQEQLTAAWTKGHEIPRSMALEYIQKLKEDEKDAEDHLRNLERFLLQLWNL